MRYFDTSFLVPLILPEATSEQIADFFETLPTDTLAISHWTRVEFASVLTREIRMGNLDTIAAREAGSRFEAMVRGSFAVLLPNSDDFDQAKNYLEHIEAGLKAGDALHLAIAGNRSVDAVYSLDKQVVAAGRMLGLPTSAGVLPG